LDAGGKVMINKQQEAEIKQILKDNLHKNCHGKITTTEEGIFKAFYRYAFFRNLFTRTFRLKRFKKIMSRPNNYPYCDCPLSRGQLLVAVRYGKRNGYLEYTTTCKNRSWHFTGKILEDVNYAEGGES
jgi:hypothetical protein